MPFINAVSMPALVSGTNRKLKSAKPDLRFSVKPFLHNSGNTLLRQSGFALRHLSANLRNRVSGMSAFLISAFLVSPVYAAGSSMPWEAPLQSILESIEGPVAKIVAVIVIIVTGLSLAFGDAGGGFRKLIQIVFGLSIAFAASSFFLSFFSFGGGVLV